MIRVLVIFAVFVVVKAGPSTEANFRGQYCVDPRTMRKHAAYTEWADAYSCTRHRCQPGGRNLAIYTVGCKRVEAPESAIECEEVVEDTNMQFPYCCTRLRCLVVVRGEVWTRVLGQPWETLPAAPWSHMYKMKKPPPGSETSFLPKLGEGPVYELQTEAVSDDENSGGKVLRSKKGKSDAECNDPPAPSPDIVIALSTGNEKDSNKKEEAPIIPTKKRFSKHPRGRSATGDSFFETDAIEPRVDEEFTEEPTTEKEKSQHRQATWTEIPPNQWNERDPGMEDAPAPKSRQEQQQQQQEQNFLEPLPQNIEEKKDESPEKPGNLQALVDAIGTRMRDIENVVQRMSEKVQKVQPGQENEIGSGEKSPAIEALYQEQRDGTEKRERPAPEGYNRNPPSKYLNDASTMAPYMGDEANNGYFSDASNSLRRMPKTPAADYFSDASNALRRIPKELPPTYMAPVENLAKRRSEPPTEPEEPQEGEDKKPRRKRVHKKKRSKNHHKKHHQKDEKNKRKRFRLNSAELVKNVVSLEDSSVNNNN